MRRGLRFTRSWLLGCLSHGCIHCVSIARVQCALIVMAPFEDAANMWRCGVTFQRDCSKHPMKPDARFLCTPTRADEMVPIRDSSSISK